MRFRHLVSRHLIDAFVVLTAVIAQLEIWLVPLEGSKPLLVVAGLAWSLPLLARNRFPLAAPAVVPVVLTGLSFLEPRTVPDSSSAVLALLLAAGLFGARERVQEVVGGTALILAGVIVVVLNDSESSLLPDVGFVGTLCLVAVVSGIAITQGSLRARELEERARLVDAQREEQARTAVADERARIAREMHDVVAHSVSVMVVQAGAAEAMLDVDPERARAPIAAVQETGREALGELRRVLGALRDGTERPDLAPRAGLAGLPALVDQVREAGLPVELEVEGEARPVPAGIELSAYRIVQEGLTNALKHAGPARARVRVRYGEDDLRVEVEDDGPGAPAPVNGAGHGLVGMRERVGLYGGDLEAGPRPEGGFALRARLPLEKAAP
ncbi:MAG: hypothetical protein QOD86_3009 [Miltoncostaeaceae bacterium]|jgi:signal transduction histidine kinase|nr:hypothetical protein [Miltoncostaeaceae bacterium]